MALALLLIGAGLVVAAGALISVPLGLAVAGSICLAAGYDLSRPRGDEA